MPQEGHTLSAFGTLLISFGGCNTIKDACTNQVSVLQTLKN